jgi:hypothetical protein
MTCRRQSTFATLSTSTLALLVATLGACGNYSNEDLEFMNAVPAEQDLSVSMPRSMILPANEAELSKLTHDTVATFNGALDFLSAADAIRTYQPTGHVPNGRVWGPIPAEQAGWQWHFVVTRQPDMPDQFEYAFELQRIGDDPNQWVGFVSGSFKAATGARKGEGKFTMQTDELRNAGFPVGTNAKDEMLKSLAVSYQTAAYPINVTMDIQLYPPDAAATGYTMYSMFHIAYEAQETGQGALEFKATDAMGNSIGVVSRWLPTGRGRADATVDLGPLMGQVRTECWDDTFRETYNETQGDPARGDMSLCPDISTL